MTRTVLIRLDLPGGLARFSFPSALRNRLTTLLDRQEERGCLTSAERKEAEGLVDLAELISLLKLPAQAARRRPSRDAS